AGTQENADTHILVGHQIEQAAPTAPLLRTGARGGDDVKLDDTRLTGGVVRAILPTKQEVLIDLVAATLETEAEGLDCGGIIGLRRADSADEVMGVHNLQDQWGDHHANLVRIVVIKAPGYQRTRLGKATVQGEDAAGRGVREGALDYR